MIKKLIRNSPLLKHTYVNIWNNRVKHSIKKHGIEYLSETLESLHEKGVLAFADFGTLLGLVREGKLLEHDLDIDVGVVVLNNDIFQIVMDAFQKIGFRISREITINGEIKEHSFEKKYIKIDIQYYFLDDQGMYCYLFYNPKKEIGSIKWNSVIKKCPLVKTVSIITIQEKRIFIPTNSENILSYKYGSNWKTPDKGWVYWEGPNTYKVEEIGILKNNK